MDIAGSFPNSQYVSDTVEATYLNSLLLNGEPESVIGEHSCQVANPRGETQVLTLQLQGEYSLSLSLLWLPLLSLLFQGVILAIVKLVAA